MIQIIHFLLGQSKKWELELSLVISYRTIICVILAPLGENGESDFIIDAQSQFR
jgi:hypothetical protein